MPTQILMPALSPTMEEGKLAKWLVAEGQQVKPGDIIAEIETDKATMEVEAVDEGTVSKLLVAEGTQGVKVNAVIAELAGEGEAPAKGNGGTKAAPPATDKKPEPVAAKPNPGPSSARPASAPESQPGTTVASSAGPAPARIPGDRVRATPLARRLARQEGVDLLALRGSGPHGRIVKADVLKAPKGG